MIPEMETKDISPTIMLALSLNGISEIQELEESTKKKPGSLTALKDIIWGG